MNITRLPQELMLLVLLAAVCVLGYWYWESSVRSDEREKVKVELDKAWRQRLRESEDKATKELIALRGEHAKVYQRLQLRADQLSRELRLRATRAEQANRPHPLTSIACPVCTGERLAREDGEFLAGEAAAAAAQQQDLRNARAEHDVCRRTLEEVTKGTRNDLPEESPGVQPGEAR